VVLLDIFVISCYYLWSLGRNSTSKKFQGQVILADTRTTRKGETQFRTNAETIRSCQLIL
jgi:hypothetical protein